MLTRMKARYLGSEYSSASHANSCATSWDGLLHCVWKRMTEYLCSAVMRSNWVALLAVQMVSDWEKSRSLTLLLCSHSFRGGKTMI